MHCLITDHLHPVFLAFLEKHQIDFTYLPNIDQKATQELMQNVDILIVNSKIKVDKTLVDHAPKLQVVGRLGSGMDNIDQDLLKAKGIQSIRTPEANANAVAEHAVGMLFSLSNKLMLADSEVRNCIWKREKLRGFEIQNKTVGIIGYGNTGRLFADKMSALCRKVYCYDKYVGVASENSLIITTSSSEEVLENADIVSLHIPLNEETQHMVDQSWLALCKPGAIVINTSRGKIINTEDLVQALERGNIGGACLDVFENEKPETYSTRERELYQKLYAMPQVVLSPHIAGWSYESYYRIANVMCEKIQSFFNLD